MVDWSFKDSESSEQPVLRSVTSSCCRGLQFVGGREGITCRHVCTCSAISIWLGVEIHYFGNIGCVSFPSVHRDISGDVETLLLFINGPHGREAVLFHETSFSTGWQSSVLRHPQRSKQRLKCRPESPEHNKMTFPSSNHSFLRTGYHSMRLFHQLCCATPREKTRYFPSLLFVACNMFCRRTLPVMKSVRLLFLDPATA